MSKQIILSNEDYKNLCELAGFALYIKGLLCSERFQLSYKDKTVPKLTEEENDSLITFVENREEDIDPDILNDIEDNMTDFDF